MSSHRGAVADPADKTDLAESGRVPEPGGRTSYPAARYLDLGLLRDTRHKMCCRCLGMRVWTALLRLPRVGSPQTGVTGASLRLVIATRCVGYARTAYDTGPSGGRTAQYQRGGRTGKKVDVAGQANSRDVVQRDDGKWRPGIPTVSCPIHASNGNRITGFIACIVVFMFCGNWVPANSRVTYPKRTS